MAMIFPGMDPYLENPDFWPGVHNHFVVSLAERLQPLVRPRYIAAIDARVYIERPPRQYVPDVLVRKAADRTKAGAQAVAEIDEAETVELIGNEIEEAYIQILDKESGQRIVTVIEVVSPSNKTAGPGRESYRKKQLDVLSSDAHLVEIDLLRAGHHVLTVPKWAARDRGTYDYLVCVNRADGPRGRYTMYRRSVREPLPRIGVPLAEPDPNVPLDLQAALERVYDMGSYRDRINYAAACRPPLSAEDQAWADELVKQATPSD
jgi:hypothetical protein